VAIKLHFGEPGNLGYIRPQFVRRIVDRIKAQGGKPYLTDANTLYVGSRANAVDHLQTAIENGFDYAVVNAPLVIADGLTGKDYLTVTVPGRHCHEVKIGAGIFHAQAMVVMSHFKGHELTGFGGAIKNLGMGSGSRSGKQTMHSDVRPKVSVDLCTACESCIAWCPTHAISLSEETNKAEIDLETCIGCGECTVTCPVQAIKIRWKTTPQSIQEKIVEYALGVVKNKPGKMLYINFLTNISPDCDCFGWNDTPLVPDIGILVSTDPVAIDQASVDLVLRQPRLAGTAAAERPQEPDHFLAVHPGMDWRHQLIFGEEIGLGSRSYSLIRV